jgi:glycosyltransferase involved in cell wall biosynthesis
MKIALVARHVTPIGRHDEQGAGQQAGAWLASEQHCAGRFCDDQAAQVLGLGHALAGLGHRVVVYARKDSPALPDAVALSPGLAVQYVPAGPAAPLSDGNLSPHIGALGGQLAARWTLTPPDLVHAFSWTSGLAALVATRESKLPVVQTFGSLGVTEQRCGLAELAAAARLRMETCLARTVHGILATTHDEAADLASLGVPGPRVTVVPGGIDPGRLGRLGGKPPSRGPRQLLHVGSLAPGGGAETLISVLPQLAGAELVLAGGPVPADLEQDERCKALGKLAAGLGVAERVTLTGRVAGPALTDLLRSADVFVSAAPHEPLGLAAISAMACGTPVVAASAGACADAVIDGTTGVLTPPGRPDMLLRRLRELVSAPMKVTAFGIGSSDRALSRYPWERIGAETLAAYQRALSRPAASADRYRERAQLDSRSGRRAA